MHREANAGHLGGNFSCVDAIITVHHRVMKKTDRFILSKGHSAGSLYVALWSIGELTDDDLKTFCKDGTRFPGHPSGSGIPGLQFPTGSLGHGPSLAAGLALAAKHQKSGCHVYCLCSDGEWQEGSCWEALTFANHYGLDNLTILIDQNGFQGFGGTQEVISCADLTPRLMGFCSNVQRVNGHDWRSILKALQRRVKDQPNVLVLDTIKGHGLHFEGTLESHYLPLSEEQYKLALKNVQGDMS